MNTTLVTGAAGFIGSNLCQRLLDNGQHVVGFDNFDPMYDLAIKHSNIESLKQHHNFKFIKDDIRNKNHTVFGNPSVIIHLAAKADVRDSMRHAVEYQSVNVEGTCNLLEFARTRNIKKFIMASSSSVYGNSLLMPLAETHRTDSPLSSYGASKKACEVLSHSYTNIYSMNITCLRFFTVYGPSQPPDLAISKFATKMIADKPIPLYGDGSSYRDYTYIDDIVDGIIASVGHCRGFNIFNLGSGQLIMLMDMVQGLEHLLDVKAKIDYLPMPLGDPMATRACLAHARKHLGYKPKVNINQGLASYVKWLLNRRNIATN